MPGAPTGSMTDGFSRFLQPGRVHRQIYADPAIFELELERVFGVAWIYVGHESQIRNPVIYTHADRAQARGDGPRRRAAKSGSSTINAPIAARSWSRPKRATPANSRAAITAGPTILTAASRRCRCARLSVRFRSEKPRKPRWRGASRRELSRLLFASEAAARAEPGSFLGHMAASLDDMADRAPDGEIEVAGGSFRHAYDANWKLYLENLCDAAHPIFTHRSSIEAAQRQPDDVHSDGSGEIAIRQMRQNGAPYSFWEPQVGIWTYPNGHSYLGDYHDDAKLVAALKDPVFRDYIAALEAKKGKNESRRVSRPALEQQHLSQPVVHEPVSAASRRPSGRGRPHRRPYLLFPPQGRARSNVPQHGQLCQRGQRHRLAGADRRSRNLQTASASDFRAGAPNRSRWAAVSDRRPEAHGGRRGKTRPAKSISATCWMHGSATCRTAAAPKPSFRLRHS